MNCITPGCGRPVDRRWDRVCNHCQERRRRQGSPWGEIVTIAHFNKHRVSSLYLMDRLDPERLEENGPDPYLAQAFRIVKEKLRSARGISAAAVRGKPPRVQADAWWARAREDGVSARNIIADGIGMARMRARGENSLLMQRDFYDTQLGRVLHRKAHSIETKSIPAAVKVNGQWVDRETSTRHRARTAGRSLRTIGRDVADAVELVVDHHLPSTGKAQPFSGSRSKSLQQLATPKTPSMSPLKTSATMSPLLP